MSTRTEKKARQPQMLPIEDPNSHSTKFRQARRKRKKALDSEKIPERKMDLSEPKNNSITYFLFERFVNFVLCILLCICTFVCTSSG